jgi:hypothetical protein
MDSPGDYVLASRPITTAIVTAEAQTAIDGLEGMREVVLEAELLGGTGGSTFTAIVRTRIGSGGALREIARFDFTTTAAKSCTIVKGATSIAALAALSANSVLQNFLGTELDCLLSSTGTYTNTTFVLRASVS